MRLIATVSQAGHLSTRVYLRVAGDVSHRWVIIQPYTCYLRCFTDQSSPYGLTFDQDSGLTAWLQCLAHLSGGSYRTYQRYECVEWPEPISAERFYEVGYRAWWKTGARLRSNRNLLYHSLSSEDPKLFRVLSAWEQEGLDSYWDLF